MESLKAWLSFKNSVLIPSKGMLFKVTSLLKHKTKEDRSGMVNLYKDMEACAGYADIQVMWEMVHSSSIDRNIEIRNTPHRRRFSFWPA